MLKTESVARGEQRDLKSTAIPRLHITSFVAASRLFYTKHTFDAASINIGHKSLDLHQSSKYVHH
eukprot:SAG11_NODE_25741_length_354_cov_1.603922_1_plen_64_part_10